MNEWQLVELAHVPVNDEDEARCGLALQQHQKPDYSNSSIFRKRQRILNIDAEVAHSVLNLRVPQQCAPLKCGLIF